MTRSATILLFAATVAASSHSDQDRDGLDDEIEQELLQKFLPTFFIHPKDCDVLPAEFRPGLKDPAVLSRNGAIYGQVKKQTLNGSEALIEIHYFHLWGRDCGRAGHALDVEHVSALVRAGELESPIPEWKADYWYAAAHENTACDVSSGSKAAALGAEDRGPSVWISKGKHASFLSPTKCSYGCGGDYCANTTAFVPAKVVNLGELHAPLNGAIWIHSARWQLATKMGTDFDEIVLAQLSNASPDAILTLKTYLRPTQALFLAGDSTFDALDLSGRSTDQALSQSFANVEDSLNRSSRNTSKALAHSSAATLHALDASTKNTGRSLKRAARGVENFLRLKKPAAHPPDVTTNPSCHPAESSKLHR